MKLPTIYSFYFWIFHDRFESWRRVYDIDFDTCGGYLHRRQVWFDNDAYIKKHNAKHANYTLKHNAFSHYSIDNFHDLKQIGASRAFERFKGIIHNESAHNDMFDKRSRDLWEVDTDWVVLTGSTSTGL